MNPNVRLLPFARADGPVNMAADEALARSAVELGTASLRFYGWQAATVSLGYFQAASIRLGNPRLGALPFVRRPSGGATLIHHHELTYALALPPGVPWHSAEPWLRRMHRIIASALGDLGLAGKIVAADAAAGLPASSEPLCFLQHTPGDLLAHSQKVVGSAQRKYRGALLQHGSILLRASPFAPELAGLYEMTGVDLAPAELERAIVAALQADTGWRLKPDEWTESERREIDELARQRYASAAWNERR